MQSTAQLIKHRDVSRISVFLKINSDLILLTNHINRSRMNWNLVVFNLPEMQENNFCILHKSTL